jgi:hypothetical protein
MLLTLSHIFRQKALEAGDLCNPYSGHQLLADKGGAAAIRPEKLTMKAPSQMHSAIPWKQQQMKAAAVLHLGHLHAT